MATISDTNAPGGATPAKGIAAQQVYAFAGVCFLVGLLLGYFFLPAYAGRKTASAPRSTNTNNLAAGMPGGHPSVTLEQMKQMANIQASTLIDKSKTDPQNSALLLQIASIYQASHQFKEAAVYFQKALVIDPKNVAARTQLASCLFYSDDADGALAQLQQALKYNPKDPNALFNLGMIKYRGKNDASGAIATWEQLLKANPNLDRKPIVEQMIAQAKSNPTPKP